MSAQSSSHLNLTQLKLQAKELLRAHANGDPGARSRIGQSHPKLAGATQEQLAACSFTLVDAQLVIARENGFSTWSQLKRHVESLVDEVSRFDQAVQAAIHGKAATLRDLLVSEPELVRDRSTSSHRCTLLHYIAANGVEQELQMSPSNAAEIASILLQAGAEVDATAQTYGGGPQQTTMNLLVSSVWPYRAGVQVSLVEVLLDGGAAIDGLADDCSPVRTALNFGYSAAAGTLERRGCRIDHLDVAAGLGRVDLMENILAQKGRLQDDESFESAFALACGSGQIEAARFLLANGADIDDQLLGQGTGLHHAILHGEGGGAPRGHPDMVRFLIESGADPNVPHGKYNATAIDFASYNGRAEIVEYLLTRGTTDLDTVLDSAARQGHPKIAQMLLTAGAKPAKSTIERLQSEGPAEMLRLLKEGLVDGA